jgi:hypothetical protein
MKIEEAIDRLNTLAGPTAEETRPLSSEELRELLKTPRKRERSIPAEEATAAIVEEFSDADENTRRSITAKLTSYARSRFLSYAAEAAVLAVRQTSPLLIEKGLVALVIENGGDDWRDSLLVLFQLYHSAKKLGMDAEETFARISLLAEPGVIKKEMRGFPLRPPGSRDLQAFCMAEEEAEDGFRYRQIPWRPLPPQTPARPAETSRQISARLTPDQQKALIGMACTLAAMALKQQSPKLVEQGLHGLALGGGALDPSESMDALAKLHDAALKLGMDARKAFADAANLAPEGDLNKAMARFPQNPDRQGGDT